MIDMTIGYHDDNIFNLISLKKIINGKFTPYLYIYE